jgi:signal transduction histidine kinase
MILIPFIITIATVWISFFIFNAIFDGAPLEMMRADRVMREAQSPDPTAQMAYSSIGIFTGFIFVMYLTNRFLTKFIFRKITQPLEMLSTGVQHISEGDLNYKIAYNENDEFKPVCDAFNDMASRLKLSIDEVQKNEQNRKELLAGISHDLRSPLTSIKAFVEGLLDGIADTPESQREYLLIIKQKTDDINNMVSQLFIYSKMDMGNYPADPELLNIADEIKDFVTASSEEYKAMGLKVEIIGEPAPKIIFADPLQLRSVFSNILENSAKYKQKDEALSTIRCVSADGIVRIIFEDDGPGVPEGVLLKLFDVFYRTDPSRNNP